MKTIIAGSRTGVTFKDVLTAVRDCGWTLSRVISGTALGADTEGEKVGKLLGIPVDLYPANWEMYGKAAGAMRNREMAEAGDALIAVWDGESKGTADMIKQAKKRGLKIHIHIVGKENSLDELF